MKFTDKSSEVGRQRTAPLVPILTRVSGPFRQKLLPQILFRPHRQKEDERLANDPQSRCPSHGDPAHHPDVTALQLMNRRPFTLWLRPGRSQVNQVRQQMPQPYTEHTLEVESRRGGIVQMYGNRFAVSMFGENRLAGPAHKIVHGTKPGGSQGGAVLWMDPDFLAHRRTRHGTISTGLRIAVRPADRLVEKTAPAVGFVRAAGTTCSS